MKRRTILKGIIGALTAGKVTAGQQRIDDSLAEQVDRRAFELRKDLEDSLLYDIKPIETPLSLYTNKGKPEWVEDELRRN